MEPALSVVVITPAPPTAAEAPEMAAETPEEAPAAAAETSEAAPETAVVPETAVTTAVAVEPPPLAAVATSVTYGQCLLWIVKERKGRTGAEIVSD